MKAATLTLLALMATLATPTFARLLPPQDYNIKLTKNTNGLDIVVHAARGPAVTVGLENRSRQTATCSASFVNYPHRPSGDEIRSAAVAPGKRATLAYPVLNFGSDFSTVFVDVNCKAH